MLIGGWQESSRSGLTHETETGVVIKAMKASLRHLSWCMHCFASARVGIISKEHLTFNHVIFPISHVGYFI